MGFVDDQVGQDEVIDEFLWVAEAKLLDAFAISLEKLVSRQQLCRNVPLIYKVDACCGHLCYPPSPLNNFALSASFSGNPII